MSKSQEYSFLLMNQDGRQVWVGGQKVNHSPYPSLVEEELNPLSEFLTGRWKTDPLHCDEQESFHYDPLQIPETTLELEKQKFHLSYRFAEGPFFSEGWTDIAHAYLQGWVINRENLAADYTEFSETLTFLIERFRLQERLVTIPYAFGSHEAIHYSTLTVTKRTEKGIFVRGTQKLPSDSLAVHELLTVASYLEEDALFIVPLNSEGLSLHIQEGKFNRTVTAYFEDVFIPRDQILAQERAESISQLFHSDLSTSYPDYQRVASLLHQMEWITGLAFYTAKETGENDKLHIQEELGELLQQLDIIKAFLHLSEIKAEKKNGSIVPNLHELQTVKAQSLGFYKRAVEILQRVSGGLFLQQFYGIDTNREAKNLFCYISEYSASSASLRMQQYQTFYAGDPEYVWSEYFKSYSTDFLKNRLKDFWDFHDSEDLIAAIPK